MRLSIIAFLLVFQGNVSFAESTVPDGYFLWEEVPAGENAFIAIGNLAELDTSSIEDNLYCYLGSENNQEPDVIKDFSCLDIKGFEVFWTKNSNILSGYKEILDMERLYQTEFSFDGAGGFIEINKAISHKVAILIAENKLPEAVKLWSANVRFIQMALSDKQSLVGKSILLVAYNLYLGLPPTLLAHSEISDADKAVIREILSYEIFDRQNGWDIKDSLEIEFLAGSKIWEEQGSDMDIDYFERRMYELSEDSIVIYQYNLQEITDKISDVIKEHEGFRVMNLLDKRKLVIDSVVGSLPVALSLLESALRKDLDVKKILEKY